MSRANTPESLIRSMHAAPLFWAWKCSHSSLDRSQFAFKLLNCHLYRFWLQLTCVNGVMETSRVYFNRHELTRFEIEIWAKYCILYAKNHCMFLVHICAMQNILGKFAFNWLELTLSIFSYMNQKQSFALVFAETYLMQCCSTLECFFRRSCVKSASQIFIPTAWPDLYKRANSEGWET